MYLRGERHVPSDLFEVGRTVLTRRGEEVGTSLLVVETSGGRSSRAKTPAALEDEEKCTHGDSPENGSRAP